MAYIGVDLDGTLAEHAPGDPVSSVGAPIPDMVERVKRWLAEGYEVRIITARVSPEWGDVVVQTAMIERWCFEVFGRELPVQAHKSGALLELWDDRAVGVIRNTGLRADEVAVDDVIGKIASWIDRLHDDHKLGDVDHQMLMYGVLGGHWKQ